MARFYFILTLLLLALSACQSTSSPTSQATQTVVGTQQQAMAEAIESQGAQIVQQGSKLQIILPTDKFFQLTTLKLKSYQVDTIKLIAHYLKNYAEQFEHPPKIRVYGYTDTVYTTAKQAELSRQYAQVIASFLWNQGFSPQQLEVQGQSSTKPVASQKTAQGSSHNRRVVIEVR